MTFTKKGVEVVFKEITQVVLKDKNSGEILAILNPYKRFIRKKNNKDYYYIKIVFEKPQTIVVRKGQHIVVHFTNNDMVTMYSYDFILEYEANGTFTLGKVLVINYN
jgi:23S rRNA-/tRNA-specific pseudouridylate synthase